MLRTSNSIQIDSLILWPSRSNSPLNSRIKTFLERILSYQTSQGIILMEVFCRRATQLIALWETSSNLFNRTTMRRSKLSYKSMSISSNTWVPLIIVIQLSSIRFWNNQHPNFKRKKIMLCSPANLLSLLEIKCWCQSPWGIKKN